MCDMYGLCVVIFVFCFLTFECVVYLLCMWVGVLVVVCVWCEWFEWWVWWSSLCVVCGG